MNETPIDVWNIETFDAGLISLFETTRQLIMNYHATDRANFLAREASDHRDPYPSNPHAGEYLDFVEALSTTLADRTIRAWHYSRLTDGEVAGLRDTGIVTSSLDTLRTRLAGRVAEGTVTAEEADVIFEASPFHKDEFGGRADKFWMVSHPLSITDGGVTDLLAHWGGESAYFNHPEGALLQKLSSIGLPRVLEIAVPLGHTRHAYPAAKALTHVYARSLGCHAERGMFDLYAVKPLEPRAIRRVVTDGEPEFAGLGLSYPAGLPHRRDDD